MPATCSDTLSLAPSHFWEAALKIVAGIVDSKHGQVYAKCDPVPGGLHEQMGPWAPYFLDLEEIALLDHYRSDECSSWFHYFATRSPAAVHRSVLQVLR